MTIEVKDQFKVKSKRTEHPNAAKYPGRVSFEFNQARIKFMNELSDDDVSKLLDGKLVIDEPTSAMFFDSILPDDIIGVGLINGINELNQNLHKEAAAYKLLVVENDRTRDVLVCRNVTWEKKKNDKKSATPFRISAFEDYQGETVEVAFEDVSVALGMGYAEILERNGELFGCDQEIEYTVKVVGKGAEPVDPSTATEVATPIVETTKP